MRYRRRARHDLNETGNPEDGAEDPQQGQESLDPIDAPEQVGRHEERERGEQPLGGYQASPGDVRREGRHEGHQEKQRDR